MANHAVDSARNAAVTEKLADVIEPLTEDPPRLDHALMEAASAGSLTCVHLLIDAGADVNHAHRGRVGPTLTPLAAASSAGHNACVVALLAAGADVNQEIEEDGSWGTDTALEHAVRGGAKVAVKLLLAAGADGNVFALDDAANGGFVEVLQLLLTSVGLRQDTLISAFSLTTARVLPYDQLWSNKRRCAEILLAQGADVNVRGGVHGHTPLTAACKHGDMDSVRLLLAAGADVNFPCSSGTTPLERAARTWYPSRPQIIRLLLTHGARVAEAPDAVQTVVDSGDLEAFRVLYAAGAAEGVDFRKTIWVENIPDMALFMVRGREKGLQAACRDVCRRQMLDAGCANLQLALRGMESDLTLFARNYLLYETL